MPEPFVLGTIALSSKVIPAWVGYAVSAGLAATTIGINYLTKPQSDIGDTTGTFDNSIIGTETFLPVIYGEFIMPLLPVFMGSDPEDLNILYGVVGQCHGHIKGLKKVYFGKTELVLKIADGDYEYDEDFKNLVSFWQRKGGVDPAPYEQLVKVFKSWTSKHLGAGVASIAFKIKFDKDLIASIPSVNLVLEGKDDIYDPRDGTTGYSTNSILCLLDYLTNPIYGTGYNINTHINIDSFISEANYCDELLDYELVEAPEKAPTVTVLERISDWLTNGATYDYKYTYCNGTLINTENEEYTFYESALSPVSNAVVSTDYGKMKLTNIANSSNALTTLKLIYRRKNSTGLYYLVGSIDFDQTTFTDNVSDSQVGQEHGLHSVWNDTPSSGLTATYTDYNTSGLDLNKYYKYKYSFLTATGETVASSASSKIETKGKATVLSLTGILTSSDNQVTTIRIYRTEGFTGTGATSKAYYKLVDISNGTTTYKDLLPDSSLNQGVIPQVSTTTLYSKIKRYTCNGLIDTGDNVNSNREKILSSCRGVLYKQSGKWSVFIPKIIIPETFELTEHNIIGDWSFKLSDASEMPNVVKASYKGKKRNWESNFAIWPKDDESNLYLSDDNNLQTNITLNLPCTTEKKTAYNICQITRKELRNNIKVALTVKEEAKKLITGNVVKLTHSLPGWIQKEFLVTAIGIYPDATVRLVLQEYNSDDYNIETLEEDPLPSSDTSFPDPTDAPDEVSNVILTEELFLDNSVSNWRIKITYTNPTNAFWDYSNVYVKAGTSSDYELYGKIDRTSEGVLYIYPIDASIEYFIKISSVSTLGVGQNIDEVTEYSYYVDPPKSPGVTDLELQNRGSSENASGNSFKFRWSAVSTTGGVDNDTLQTVSLGDEGIQYIIETFFTGIPSTVTIGGQKVNSRPGRTVTQENTEFEYTPENEIEDSILIWENQTANKTYYNTYYGIPQREITLEVKTINKWGVVSDIKARLKAINKAPDMLMQDGTTLIKPDVEPIGNGARIKWSHPPEEYDINYFMLLVAGDQAAYRTNAELAEAFVSTRHKYDTNYVLGDIVYPQELNGYCYKCTVAGRTATEAIFIQYGSWPISSQYPTSEADLHPTINDGSVHWQLWCVLEQIKVVGQATVDSTDDEIDSMSYLQEVTGLDPKKTFRTAVVPYDMWGVGTISNISDSFLPSLSDDDTGGKITNPATPATPALTYESDLNEDGTTETDLKIKWTKNTEIDIDGYYLEYRAVKNSAATTPPTDDDIDTGTTATGGYKCYGDVKEVSLDGVAGTGNLGKTTVTRRLKSVKHKFTYFVRLQAQNTSLQKSEWSAWVYLAATKSSGAIFDVFAPDDNENPSANPTVGVIAYGSTLETTATIANSGVSLAGFQFSAKATAFTGDIDRNDYKYTTIDSKDGKAVSLFSGDAGDSWYLSVRGYDTSENYSAWVDYASNPITIPGVTNTNLSEAYKKFQYKGELSSSAYNKISWTAENLKFKDGDTYAITAATNSTVTGSMVVTWSKTVTSGTVFTLVDYDTYYLNATYKDYTAIALVEVNSDTGSEATIIPFESSDYNVTASMLTASRLIVSSAQLGDLVVTSAKINSLVADKITGGTITGQTILLGTGGKFATAASGARVEIDSTGIKSYDATSQRIQILNDGSGWLGSSASFSWNTAGVAIINADAITAGTLVGRTIKTTSGTGGRIELDSTVNEMRCYNASNAVVASIGILSPDSLISQIGTTTYAGRALLCMNSHSQPTADFRNYGTKEAIYGASDSGDCLSVGSASGAAGVFRSNPTRGCINMSPQTGFPTTPLKGDHFFNNTTGVNKSYCYDGTYWQSLWVGISANTAILHLPAGTATASPQKLSSGTNLTTPEAGAIEYDGKVKYFTPVASNRGVALSTHFIALSADFMGSDVNTPQPVFNASTNGTITLPASTTYEMDALYVISRSAGTTTHNLGILFGGTATITSIAYIATFSNAPTVVITTVAKVVPITVATLALLIANISDATEEITIRLKGLVRINGAGTFIPQIQYSAAPGGAPTFRANSFLKLTPLGDNTVTNVGNWS